jgi:hypothetical protein
VADAFVNITDKPARQFILILPGLDAVAFFTGLGAVMRDVVRTRHCSIASASTGVSSFLSRH